jgi:hypothetical protein
MALCDWDKQQLCYTYISISISICIHIHIYMHIHSQSSKVDEAVQASNGTSVVALGIVHDQQLLWTYGAGIYIQ